MFSGSNSRRASNHVVGKYAWQLFRDKSTLAFEAITGNHAPGTSSQGIPHKTGIVLHGLLGTGRNWRTVIRGLIKDAEVGDNRPWRMLLVDLRNHGASSQVPGFHPPHSMEAAAGDVAALIQSELGGSAPDAVVGHSLGGKVALELLQQLKEGQHGFKPPPQVWVLDSQPGSFESSKEKTDSVAHILDIIRGVALPVPSRNWLYDQLAQQGVTQGTAQWLGSNLGQDSKRGGLTWTFNIQGAAAMYNSYRSSSYWELLSCPPPGVGLHMVRAMRSDRWTPDTIQQLAHCQERNKASHLSDPGHCGQLHVHELANAGHWLHTDNPDGLLRLMRPWFER